MWSVGGENEKEGEGTVATVDASGRVPTVWGRWCATASAAARAHQQCSDGGTRSGGQQDGLSGLLHHIACGGFGCLLELAACAFGAVGAELDAALRHGLRLGGEVIDGWAELAL